jgi:hypothetical protein
MGCRHIMLKSNQVFCDRRTLQFIFSMRTLMALLLVRIMDLRPILIWHLHIRQGDANLLLAYSSEQFRLYRRHYGL